MTDKKLIEKTVTFSDNEILQKLVGAQSAYLKRLEKHFHLKIRLVGNRMTLSGEADVVEKATTVLARMEERLQKGDEVDHHDVDGLVRMHGASQKAHDTTIRFKGTNRSIAARSESQADFIQAMRDHELTFGIGPAGTGKTYLAVAMGAALFMERKVDRLILSRPAIEAGENLGFLPGDLKEKVDPYLRPIYDALNDMFKAERVAKLIESGDIEIAPLAFMRGRTLSNAFVILDEAQNTTPLQMKMFLTRLGENSRMVVTGDVTQIDLDGRQESGLVDALKRFKSLSSVAFTEFGTDDVVRHPLVAQIVKAYAR